MGVDLLRQFFSTAERTRSNLLLGNEPDQRSTSNVSLAYSDIVADKLPTADLCSIRRFVQPCLTI
jgi:hypothetical protein